MRLINFSDHAGPRLGVLADHGDHVLDVSAQGASAKAAALSTAVLSNAVPSTMEALLAGGSRAMDAVRDAVARGTSPAIPVAQVEMLPPVPRPGALLCIGYNYLGHGDDDGEVPEHPDVFAKAPNSLIGPGHAIVLPPESREVDYEGELAVVIGSTASRVSEDEALMHVAGYTIVNDVSARDVQRWGSQWTLGKSFDTFGPMGPWLTTADEVPDPQALDITVTCHGEVTVSSSTSRMIRSVAYLVSYLSRAITLRPGDVIATGTPGKLPGPAALNRFVSPGDTVSITYGHLGTLTSPVVAHSSTT
jgi:acylpyruvate hydrolase